MSKSRRKNHLKNWNQKEQESFFLRDIEKKKRKEFEVFEEDAEYIPIEVKK